MISKEEASSELNRLSGLDFWPAKNDPALRELRLAAEAAASPRILRDVIDEWLREQREAPKPADIRRLVWDANGKVRESVRRCGFCGGIGLLTSWHLVTYSAKGSFHIIRSERLACTSEEESKPYRERLRDDQAIVTASRDCVCRTRPAA